MISVVISIEWEGEGLQQWPGLYINKKWRKCQKKTLEKNTLISRREDSIFSSIYGRDFGRV